MRAATCISDADIAITKLGMEADGKYEMEHLKEALNYLDQAKSQLHYAEFARDEER